MKLSGKSALVIGGSAGLGRACAEACAAEGASVMIADINQPAAEAALAAISAAGGTASFILTDGTDDAAVSASVNATVAQFGGLDILVNSIGGGRSAGDAGWHQAIDLFLKSSYYACKYAIAEMEKRGGGSVINIASIAGVTGSVATDVMTTGYACAKHGVVGLTRTLALAYAKKNIRVNVICPGYFKTEMTPMIHDKEDGGLSHINDNLRVPMGRWGEPHEIGTVAAFLASDESSFITGQPIVVDGGFMAR
ncbi:NAD(P)-dependent dehydrogenase, short-chain alcohol dehydrogenase family [Novosphingobium sp. CF614]|uniref:SDR family NAD(P)-dependent oxidoreductase n=1 Tax=Novosphingobium sp. CF614 TaxID=1884364 RepID=UPI0008F13215|nr:SDR family NAD(P)-dependent oxidoreductase [Novosphingobium sp. CF614]SFG46875.1 NAD(P)-dependent dehydrogenase, short-chain alcohol dehydrogenase family [Novosphingobium sp. CF614]